MNNEKKFVDIRLGGGYKKPKPQDAYSKDTTKAIPQEVENSQESSISLRLVNLNKNLENIMFTESSLTICSDYYRHLKNQYEINVAILIPKEYAERNKL